MPADAGRDFPAIYAGFVTGVTVTGDSYHCGSIPTPVNQSLMESATQPSCYYCEFRPDRLFCDMPVDALQLLDTVKSLAIHPKGSVLFAEGRPARGIFVLCDGRAKLSICSETGKRLMLCIAGPGEVLGLGAAMSGTPYEISAELLDTSQVMFIRRKDLLKFLREHSDLCIRVVQMLSQDLHAAYERVRSIGLARTRRPRAASASAD
jgi:CRP/FNR family transcriptional regulator